MVRVIYKEGWRDVNFRVEKGQKLGCRDKEKYSVFIPPTLEAPQRLAQHVSEKQTDFSIAP